MQYRNFKNSLILFSFFGLVIYCSDDPELGDENLIGKWQHSETLIDPGDGSGEFYPVESDKFIEFLSNGQIRSNGDLCRPSTDSDMETTGVFMLPDSVIKADNCNGPITPPKFSVRENEMVLEYFCFERCSEKYVKIP